MNGPAQPKCQTRYLLHVVKASEIVWESQWFSNPSPFIQVSLAGQPIYATAAKSRTRTPVWDERLKLKSNDPTSMLLVNLRSTMIIPGFTSSIGSTKIRIQDLEELGNLTPDISLEMFDMGKKTGVVVVRFTKIESPPVAKPNIPANVPSDKKKLQNVGYQSQGVSMDQAERIVKQILAR